MTRYFRKILVWGVEDLVLLYWFIYICMYDSKFICIHVDICLARSYRYMYASSQSYWEHYFYESGFVLLWLLKCAQIGEYLSSHSYIVIDHRLLICFPRYPFPGFPAGCSQPSVYCHSLGRTSIVYFPHKFNYILFSYRPIPSTLSITWLVIISLNIIG